MLNDKLSFRPDRVFLGTATRMSARPSKEPVSLTLTDRGAASIAKSLPSAYIFVIDPHDDVFSIGCDCTAAAIELESTTAVFIGGSFGLSDLAPCVSTRLLPCSLIGGSSFSCRFFPHGQHL